MTPTLTFAGTQERAVLLDQSALNEQDDTISLSFSSETPAFQMYRDKTGKPVRVREILDHSEGAVLLDRLNANGPLLVNHDINFQVGAVYNAVLVPERKCRCLGRFSKSQRAREIRDDVFSGIRRNVSVHYIIHEGVDEGIVGGVHQVRITKWEPTEVSLVSKPADTSVGVNREASTYPNETQSSNMNKPLFEATPAIGGDNTPQRSQVEIVAELRQQEALRAKNIREMAASTENEQLIKDAEEAVRSGISLDDFNKRAWEVLVSDRKAHKKERLTDPNLGLTHKQATEEWSMFRFINAIVEKDWSKAPFELECSRAIEARAEKKAAGGFIPFDVLSSRMAFPHMAQRTMTTGVPAEGGVLVQQEYGSMIELLRNQLVTRQLGVTVMSGLKGDIEFPKLNGGFSMKWLPENAETTNQKLDFRQLKLRPKRVGIETAYTKLLSHQSSPEVEAIARAEMMEAIAQGFDTTILNGDTTEGAPQGIVQLADSGNDVELADNDAPTWEEIVKFETNVANANAVKGRLGYAVRPTIRGKLKTTPKFTNTGFPIWENDNALANTGSLNGYPAIASLNVPAANPVIFGNWADVVLALWADVDMTVDPFSLARQGAYRIVFNMYADIGLRHDKSFAKGK